MPTYIRQHMRQLEDCELDCLRAWPGLASALYYTVLALTMHARTHCIYTACTSAGTESAGLPRPVLLPAGIVLPLPVAKFNFVAIALH